MAKPIVPQSLMTKHQLNVLGILRKKNSIGIFAMGYRYFRYTSGIVGGSVDVALLILNSFVISRNFKLRKNRGRSMDDDVPWDEDGASMNDSVQRIPG